MEKRNDLIFRFFDWKLAKGFFTPVFATFFIIIIIINISVSYADETTGIPASSGEMAPFDGQYVIHLSEINRPGVSGRPEPGYFDTLVSELFTKAGLKASFIDHMPWKRQMEESERASGHVLYPTTRSEEREDKFHWIGPISRTLWNLYGFSRYGWDRIGFDTILRDVRIGVLMGSAREAYLRKRGAQKLIILPREELLLPMLQAGRIDLIAIGGNILNHYIAQANMQSDEGDIADIDGVVPYRSCYLYIAISGNVPEGDISRLQAQLDRFKTDGFFLENRRAHGLSTNPESSFIQAMLNLGNNGVRCIDLPDEDKPG